MARNKKTFKPTKSRKSGIKTQKRLVENAKVLKNYSN